MGPLAAYRNLWLPELLVLAMIAAAAIAGFAATELDIASARRFFWAGAGNPWPVASQPLWSFFYHSAPWVTGSLALAGAATLVTGIIQAHRRLWRVYGAFILLAVVLGPGLMINGILKDHWGRPRPRQIAEFGGLFEYVPPLVMADTPGRSFPCGHCSVGYLYGIGWWLWRRRHPVCATMSLVTGMGIGTLLGIGRMAAGGHFLSDAIWAGLIAYGVAHVLYYYVLRIPAREDSQVAIYPELEKNPRRRDAVIAGTVALGIGIVVGGIVASPHDRDLSTNLRFANYPSPPRVLEFSAETLDLELILVDAPTDEVRVAGHVYGFGLPSNQLAASWEFVAQPEPTLRFRINAQGWFPDIDGLMRVWIPAGTVTTIRARISRGDISVVNPATAPPPALDLQTADGRVRR